MIRQHHPRHRPPVGGLSLSDFAFSGASLLLAGMVCFPDCIWVFPRFTNLVGEVDAAELVIARCEDLLEQRDILERETAAADLHKRMAEYTTEKNRANQNLLTLYAVLNVTALAMIFYIART